MGAATHSKLENCVKNIRKHDGNVKETNSAQLEACQLPQRECRLFSARARRCSNAKDRIIQTWEVCAAAGGGTVGFRLNCDALFTAASIEMCVVVLKKSKPGLTRFEDYQDSTRSWESVSPSNPNSGNHGNPLIPQILVQTTEHPRGQLLRLKLYGLAELPLHPRCFDILRNLP